MSKEVAFMVIVKKEEGGRERGFIWEWCLMTDGQFSLSEEKFCRKEATGQSCIRRLILAENFCRRGTDEE